MVLRSTESGAAEDDWEGLDDSSFQKNPLVALDPCLAGIFLYLLQPEIGSP
jgi:hypothetical protein